MGGTVQTRLQLSRLLFIFSIATGLIAETLRVLFAKLIYGMPGAILSFDTVCMGSVVIILL